MKRESLLSTASAFSAVCVLAAVCSCEWDRSNDDATWNDAYESKYEWVNFSGVYQHTSGWYVVTQFRRPDADSGSSSGGSSGSTTVVGAQTVTVGTGNDVQRSFGGDLPSFHGSVPVMSGTFSIRGTIQPGADVEVFSDKDNDGLLYSSQAGNTSVGFVNYYTGAFSVQFLFPVMSNTSVIATYVAGTSSTQTNVTVTTPTQRPRPGSSQPIYQFLIFQDGYRLRLTDNYGKEYEGRIITMESTGGGQGNTGPTEIPTFTGLFVPGVVVVASFNASGNGATLSGTLEGTYYATVQPDVVDPGAGTGQEEPDTSEYSGVFGNRVIRGLWVEEDTDLTGEIEGVSTEPTAIAGTVQQ